MATPLQKAPQDPLSALRLRLDEIDDELHRLLSERFRIVAEVGRAKGPGESVMRPGREAAVLARRLSANDGAVPGATLAHVWRVLVAASCAVQRPYAVHVGPALDAARFLYGPVRVEAHGSDVEAAAALADRPDDVAVVEAPALAEHRRWRGGAHVIGMASVVRTDGTPASPVAVLGGGNVARGDGACALVIRGADTLHEVPAGEVAADDVVVGRYDPFPLEIPVAR